MKITRRIVALGLIAKAWSQDQPTFSADVNVVSILATVRDKDGRIVQDLNANDFVLLEDGVPQKIRYFSREANLPLTIGLLVDTCRSQIGVVRQEGRASWTFLEQVLRPDRDQACSGGASLAAEPATGFKKKSGGLVPPYSCPIGGAKRDWLGKESTTTRFRRLRRTVLVNASDQSLRSDHITLQGRDM